MRRHWMADVALGGLSGLVASWAMERFQMIGSSESGEQEEDNPSENEKQENESEVPATVKAARTAANLVGKEIPKEREHLAGELVHFSHGAFWGAVYAVAAPREANAFLAGLAFGTGVWLLADEILVPLFGWAEGPTAYPPSVHGKALAAHLVYGVTTAAGIAAGEAIAQRA